MVEYWNEQEKAKIIFDIVFGLILALVCAGIIHLGLRAMKQTKNVDNNSINIVNLWIYRCMISGLVL